MGHDATQTGRPNGTHDGTDRERTYDQTGHKNIFRDAADRKMGHIFVFRDTLGRNGTQIGTRPAGMGHGMGHKPTPKP